MTPWLLGIPAFLLPVAALVIYRWGYRAGVEAGERSLEAYKAGMANDGGCWVKNQPAAPGPG